jgi:hypothetical protein
MDGRTVLVIVLDLTILVLWLQKKAKFMVHMINIVHHTKVYFYIRSLASKDSLI